MLVDAKTVEEKKKKENSKKKKEEQVRKNFLTKFIS